MSRSNLDNSVYGWRAVVPATSANLGCAFDCGGLALRLYLRALFIPSAGAELSLEYQGKTPERFPMSSSNLVLHALRLAAERLDAPPPAGHVLVQSDIPISVGLGSSAAAVVAGLLLGVQHSGKEVAPELFLRWAEEIEGHIDNAAAAYHGGLVLALSNNVERVVVAKTNFPDSIRLVIVTPSITVPTTRRERSCPNSMTALTCCIHCNGPLSSPLPASQETLISFRSCSRTSCISPTVSNWCRGWNGAWPCIFPGCLE